MLADTEKRKSHVLKIAVVPIVYWWQLFAFLYRFFFLIGMDSLSNHSDSSNKSNTLPGTYGSLQKRNGFADHEMLSYDHAVTLEGPDDRPTVLVKTKEHDDAEKSSVSEETEKPVHPLKRRLLGVAFTTLLCYICVAYSLGSTSSQYLYHRISKNHFNASNGTQSSVTQPFYVLLWMYTCVRAGVRVSRG